MIQPLVDVYTQARSAAAVLTSSDPASATPTMLLLGASLSLCGLLLILIAAAWTALQRKVKRWARLDPEVPLGAGDESLEGYYDDDDQHGGGAPAAVPARQRRSAPHRRQRGASGAADRAGLLATSVEMTAADDGGAVLMEQARAGVRMSADDGLDIYMRGGPPSVVPTAAAVPMPVLSEPPLVELLPTPPPVHPLTSSLLGSTAAASAVVQVADDPNAIDI